MFLNTVFSEVNMNSIGNIIATYRKKKNWSQIDLARVLSENGFEITNRSVSKWEKDDTEPNLETFFEICRILEIPDIYEAYFGKNPFNRFDVLNEEGKKKVNEYIELLLDNDKYKKDELPDDVISFPQRMIPLMDLPASAGLGQYLDSENYEMIPIGDDVPAEADFAIRIAGDSMEPRFMHGQIVWVKRQNTLNNGEIGIFALDGDAYCKKVKSDGRELFLLSYNRKYAPIRVTSDREFKIFGRVLG